MAQERACCASSRTPGGATRFCYRGAEHTPHFASRMTHKSRRQQQEWKCGVCQLWAWVWRDPVSLVVSLMDARSWCMHAFFFFASSSCQLHVLYCISPVLRAGSGDGSVVTWGCLEGRPCVKNFVMGSLQVGQAAVSHFASRILSPWSNDAEKVEGSIKSGSAQSVSVGLRVGQNVGIVEAMVMRNRKVESSETLQIWIMPPRTTSLRRYDITRVCKRARMLGHRQLQGMRQPPESRL